MPCLLFVDTKNTKKEHIKVRAARSQNRGAGGTLEHVASDRVAVQVVLSGMGM
jgi:hypothetical protein